MSDLNEAIAEVITTRLGRTRKRLANSLAHYITEMIDQGFYRNHEGEIEQFNYCAWNSERDEL